MTKTWVILQLFIFLLYAAAVWSGADGWTMAALVGVDALSYAQGRSRR